MSKKILPTLLFGLTLLLAACSGDNPIISPSAIGGEVTPATPNKLVIEPGTAAVELGKTTRLTTLFNQEGQIQRNLPTTWVSLNPDIATVDANGNITGLKPGNARIKAETLGQAAEALISVTLATSGGATTPPASGGGITTVNEDSNAPDELAKLRTIVIRPVGEAVQPITFKLSRLGEQRQFEAIGKDAEGQDIPNLTFTWTSSREPVATVNSTGVVTAVATGVSNLIATAGNVTSNTVIVEVQSGIVNTLIKFSE